MIRLTHKEEAEQQAKADAKEAKAEAAQDAKVEAASKAPPCPTTLKGELEAQLAEYMRKGAAGDEPHIHTLRTRLANLK